MHVRHNVYALRPGGPKISALRSGVRAMKHQHFPQGRSEELVLPGRHPRLHPYAARSPGAKELEHVPACQLFFFLSWHRMYIYYFERILRAASGDPDLALPYWNYSDPAQRALPTPFREPAGSQNPLYVSQRQAGINAGAELPASDVSAAQMFKSRRFLPRQGSRLSFGGEGPGAGALLELHGSPRGPAAQYRSRESRGLNGIPTPRPRTPSLGCIIPISTAFGSVGWTAATVARTP